MRDDYKAAKRLGDEAVRKANRTGQSPYLPVMDTMEAVKQSVGQSRLGLLELPLSRIKGNKEAARNNAFANNFMPIFDEGTEFAFKWSNLYDSYLSEGIRDAIKVYEFMNKYYVQEGNKRVSVSKFGGTEFILADVTRILPKKDGSKEVRAYYEYLDFYKATKIFLIVFNEPGEYAKLAELLGQDLENEWPESLCLDLKSAFYRFTKICKKEMSVEDEVAISNAFLIYISIFAFKSFEDTTDEQIASNIRLAHDEFAAAGAGDNAIFLEDTAQEVQEEKPAGIMSLFSKTKKYTAASPLRVGFIYDADIEESRWIDSHEAGRLYVSVKTDDNVVTSAYNSKKLGSVKAAIDEALKDKNEIIFAVSPGMMKEVLNAAVRNPKVKFLNCSVGEKYASLRCYHGKLYEASFLMGILAADTLLRSGTSAEERRIGYLARKGGSMSVIDLNAFAIGVSMIDPECKIKLEYTENSETDSIIEKWKAEGITLFADMDYTTGMKVEQRPGLYKIEDSGNKYIGAPFFNWGKYYFRIVHSVLAGTWNLDEAMNRRASANYWFGLSTGVVDVIVPRLPYQTSKMLAFFRNSLIKGEISPFAGEIHTQDGLVINQESKKKGRGIAMSLDTMNMGDIVSMNWFNDNIEGTMPVNE